jgi:hypothetical protein
MMESAHGPGGLSSTLEEAKRYIAAQGVEEARAARPSPDLDRFAQDLVFMN